MFPNHAVNYFRPVRSSIIRRRARDTNRGSNRLLLPAKPNQDRTHKSQSPHICLLIFSNSSSPFVSHARHPTSKQNTCLLTSALPPCLRQRCQSKQHRPSFDFTNLNKPFTTLLTRQDGTHLLCCGVVC